MDIQAILAALATLVIAWVYSMFGMGGGSLYTPVLLFLGYSTRVSISTALVLNCLTAGFAGIYYFRAGVVDRRLVSEFLPGVVAGALVGGAVGGSFEGVWVLAVLAAFLAVAGTRMALSYRTEEPSSGAEDFARPSLGVIAPVSLGVGFLSGLLGIAGAIILVPFLIYYCGTPTKVAAGSSAPIVICSALAGLAGRFGTVEFDTPLLAFAAVAAAVGGSLGPRFMVRMEARSIRVAFGAVLWVFAALLVVRLL
jgi:uncharacterized protein